MKSLNNVNTSMNASLVFVASFFPYSMGSCESSEAKDNKKSKSGTSERESLELNPHACHVKKTGLERRNKIRKHKEKNHHNRSTSVTQGKIKSLQYANKGTGKWHHKSKQHKVEDIKEKGPKFLRGINNAIFQKALNSNQLEINVTSKIEQSQHKETQMVLLNSSTAVIDNDNSVIQAMEEETPGKGKEPLSFKYQGYHDVNDDAKRDRDTQQQKSENVETSPFNHDENVSRINLRQMVRSPLKLSNSTHRSSPWLPVEFNDDPLATNSSHSNEVIEQKQSAPQQLKPLET